MGTIADAMVIAHLFRPTQEDYVHMTAPKPGPIAVSAHSTREPVAGGEGPSSPVNAPSTPCDPQTTQPNTDPTHALGQFIGAEVWALRQELEDARTLAERQATEIAAYRDALSLIAKGIHTSRSHSV